MLSIPDDVPAMIITLGRPAPSAAPSPVAGPRVDLGEYASTPRSELTNGGRDRARPRDCRPSSPPLGLRYAFGRYDIDDLRKDTSAGHNIVQTVFIECSANYRDTGPKHLYPVGETEFVERRARKSPTRRQAP
ncbi:MAG: hypothetical protein R2706_19535 [Acidimicrobiales bacterium]